MRIGYSLACGLMLAFIPLHPMAGQVIKSAGCAVDLGSLCVGLRFVEVSVDLAGQGAFSRAV
jgi:hypothetical protein